MLRLSTLVPAFIGVVAAQSVTITDGATYTAVPTPDALPLDDLLTLPPPVVTSTPGLESDISSYVAATAIASAVADQTENPLSVFPAVTDIPINQAGEDDSDDDLVTSSSVAAAPTKRDIEARAACDPQPTIANYYSVNVGSYSAFKADPTIASVANSAPTPSGYTQNFKNLGGSSNALGYLGYSIVNKGNTGYDVNWCANKCNSISGCMSFNIYFERDPTVAPGDGCTNPPAFANIKCSFWGSGLTADTAKDNGGQYRAQFQVGIAGSNGYTSWKLGGPIPNYGAPQNLNTSIMQSPSTDCSGQYTYMGFKLYQNGPYDVNVCAAACDAQTAYNLKYPPQTGKPSKCAAFGTYQLTLTNKTGSYPVGQMCTMYTSLWDKSLAKGTVGYDDRIGAKYTYSYSFFYSRPDIQPICKADISSLQASGADFCTSYLGYVAPVTTTTTTTTPALITTTIGQTVNSIQGVTATGLATTTVQAAGNYWRRQDSSEDALPTSLTVSADYTTVDSVPDYTAVVLAEVSQTVTVANGTVPTNAPDNLVAADITPAKRAVFARAIATPANVVGWPSTRISEACSAVATGTSTSVSITIAPTPVTSTTSTTTVVATTMSACVVPTMDPAYETFTPIWGVWNGKELGDNPYAVAGAEKTLQLPFTVGFAGGFTDTVSVGSNGYIKIAGNYLYAFAGQGSGLYLYNGKNGVFYRVAGAVGSRSVVFSWFAGTYNYGHQQNHFTITLFENRPGYAQLKYYNVVMQPGPSAYVGLSTPSAFTYFLPYGQEIAQGTQVSIYAPDTTTPKSVISMHDRAACCNINANWWWGWATCTEYQAPRLDSLAPPASF